MTEEQEQKPLAGHTPEGSVPVEPESADLGAREADALAESEPAEPLVRMTLGEHLEDLRRRLFYSVLGLVLAMILTLSIGGYILDWIRIPFVAAMKAAYGDASKVDTALKVFEITGAFSMYLRVALYAGLVLASPWIFYQMWMFIGAGLYKNEKRYVHMAVPFSVGLFLAGAAFAIHLSVQAIEFFIKFGARIGVEPIITLDDYVSFMIKLVLAFGVVFQMPLVVLVLAKVGLVDMRRLNRYRRHVVVGCAVIAAVLAPPDIVSMLAMILPMWLLYEAGIGLAWLLIFRKRPKGEGDESE
jgi:sec-independent protein translocase protein TatC